MAEQGDTREPEGAAGQRRQRSPRVLVAFSGGDGTAALCRAAGTLATALRAELAGLFVREGAVRDLAALGVAVGYRPGRDVPEAVTAERVERAWRREEEACRSALKRFAAAGTVAVSFRTTEGTFGHSLAENVRAGDIVAFATGLPGLQGWKRLAPIWQASSGLGAVLLCSSQRTYEVRSTRDTAPILAIDDGDRLGAESVRLAARIAQATGRPLALLAIAGPLRSEAIAERARAIFGASEVEIHALPYWDLRGLCRAISRIAPSLVIADAESEYLAEEEIAERLTNATAVPLVLLRGVNDPGG